VSHKRSVDLRSFQLDTSLHCQTTDTGRVHRALCLLVFTSEILPTHGGMVTISWWMAVYIPRFLQQ